MAKEFAFLFYPGEYLRDTQCLSSNSQVAYDRIICEHMRNICIPKHRIDFFTKRLNPDEVEEVKHVLTEIDGGFQITWVADSINKRNGFVESRRENRSKKNKKDMTNISKSHDEHKVIVNEIVIVKEKGKEKVAKGIENLNFPFSSPEFDLAWKTLLQLPVWKKKPATALQAALNKLSRVSEPDALIAIENATAGNWLGIFPERNKKEQKSPIQSRVEIAEMYQKTLPE